MSFTISTETGLAVSSLITAVIAARTDLSRCYLTAGVGTVPDIAAPGEVVVVGPVVVVVPPNGPLTFGLAPGATLDAPGGTLPAGVGDAEAALGDGGDWVAPAWAKAGEAATRRTKPKK